MARASRPVDELAKVAQLYYVDDLSQQEIAERMGTTRSNVSRMLKAAKEQGLVEIRIVHPGRRDPGLEEALKRRFRIADARVAAFGAEHSRARQGLLAQVGKLAASWLDEAAHDGMLVGLSWGTTLRAMVDATVGERRHGIEIVQLVGGLFAHQSDSSGHDIARELADRVGATYTYLHAPAVLESSAACQTLLREPSIHGYLDRARHAELAVVGIGARGVGSSSLIVDSLNLSAAERVELEASGYVGDVCGRFYDLGGHEVRSAARDRVVAVSLEDLRGIPTVVGVLAGREKALGALGALRGRILDVVVCDESAARTILDLDGAP
jgi:DNA-binding transcriptional regulator LsrR (DeoR family)